MGEREGREKGRKRKGVRRRASHIVNAAGLHRTHSLVTHMSPSFPSFLPPSSLPPAKRHPTQTSYLV